MDVSLRRIALALLVSFAAGCGFPEGDYGFNGGNADKDAAVDPSTDTFVPDNATDDTSNPPDDVTGDEAAVEEPGSDAEPDSDGGTEVGPDAPDVGQDTLPDVPPDVPKDVPVDVPPDVAPEAPLPPLLNVWHIPTNPEPPTITMRNPRFPAAGGNVNIYFGIQPIGQTTGANLYWWWSGETAPHVVAFAWDSNNGNNEYWKAVFPMPARPVGTFRYYIEVTPKFPATNSTTWLYGTDSATNTTYSKTTASGSPYKPDVRLPTAGGDGGVSEIVITEAMVNARGGTPETPKEWFEVFCGAPVPVTLDGCKVGDAAAVHTIADPELILWPGIYAVFGNTMDQANMDGFLPDYAYGSTSSIQFANTGDTIRVLLPSDTLIDQVVFSSATGFPTAVFGTDAHSMQHKTLTPSAVDNDTGTNWCQSLKAYGLGTSYGTPQAKSDLCAP
ncbi:MAG: lamin tail domain-containing protein [Deltaproteobacteria bacterium]|nr:lamin tail domain-containing protein [Deltaproteobacteria bacterium]